MRNKLYYFLLCLFLVFCQACAAQERLDSGKDAVATITSAGILQVTTSGWFAKRYDNVAVINSTNWPTPIVMETGDLRIANLSLTKPNNVLQHSIGTVTTEVCAGRVITPESAVVRISRPSQRRNRYVSQSLNGVQVLTFSVCFTNEQSNEIYSRALNNRQIEALYADGSASIQPPALAPFANIRIIPFRVVTEPPPDRQASFIGRTSIVLENQGSCLSDLRESVRLRLRRVPHDDQLVPRSPNSTPALLQDSPGLHRHEPEDDTNLSFGMAYVILILAVLCLLYPLQEIFKLCFKGVSGSAQILKQSYQSIGKFVLNFAIFCVSIALALIALGIGLVTLPVSIPLSIAIILGLRIHEWRTHRREVKHLRRQAELLNARAKLEEARNRVVKSTLDGKHQIREEIRHVAETNLLKDRCDAERKKLAHRLVHDLEERELIHEANKRALETSAEIDEAYQQVDLLLAQAQLAFESAKAVEQKLAKTDLNDGAPNLDNSIGD